VIFKNAVLKRDSFLGGVFTSRNGKTILTVLLQLAKVLCEVIVEAHAISKSFTSLATLPWGRFPHFLTQVGSASYNCLTFNLDPVVGDIIDEIDTLISGPFPLAPWEVLSAGVFAAHLGAWRVSVSNEVAHKGVPVELTGVLRVLVTLAPLAVPHSAIIGSLWCLLMNTLVVLPLTETRLELLALALLVLRFTNVGGCRGWVGGHSLCGLGRLRLFGGSWGLGGSWRRLRSLGRARGIGWLGSWFWSYYSSPTTVVPVPVVVAECGLAESDKAGLHVVGITVHVTESRLSTACTPISLGTGFTGAKASAQEGSSHTVHIGVTWGPVQTTLIRVTSVTSVASAKTGSVGNLVSVTGKVALRLVCW